MLTPKINTKSIARIAAIQTLYQFASRKGESDIDSVLARMKEFYRDSDFKNDHDIDAGSRMKLRPSYSYLDELVKCTYDNLQEADLIISGYLSQEWTLENLPPLLHALLRVAVCEINYFPDTPRKVIINEYTDIANDMLDKNETGFVNSILHTQAHSATYNR